MTTNSAKGWVWYPKDAPAKPQSQPPLSYRGAPAPDFGDDSVGAVTPARFSEANPSPAVEAAAVRMPPAIPANGPDGAAPAGSAPGGSAPGGAEPRSQVRRRVRAPVDASAVDQVRATPVASPIVVDPSRPRPQAAPAAPLPPFHWVQNEAPPREKRHTFEFSGAAAKLNDGKSIMVDSIDFVPMSPPEESVLQTGNTTWVLAGFALVFVAASVAFLLSSEITVGVHELWATLTTMK